MPYKSNKDLPESVQKLPEKAKTIFRKAFNSAIDQGNSEESAFKIAWAAVKKKYKKNKDGKWVKATEPAIISFFGPAQTVAVEASEDDDPAIAARSEIQIMRPGRWDHPDYGEFEISESDIDEFKDNFDKNVRGVRLAVDVNHEDDHEAVGWFEELIDKGKNGLWAVVGWTKKGYELIKDGAYRYFSPEFAPAWSDPETGNEYENVLFGGAVTNRPFIKNMAAVALSEDVDLRPYYPALDIYKEIVDDGNDSDVSKKDDKSPIDLKEKAREKFGFSEDELETILACEYDVACKTPQERSLLYAINELLSFWMKKLEAGDKAAAEEVEPIINNLQSLIKEGLDKKSDVVLKEDQMSDKDKNPTDDKDKVQAQEPKVPEGKELVDKEEVKKLREEAEETKKKLAEATRTLQEKEISENVDTLIFSEANKGGRFKEESKDRLTKFMLTLSEEQRKEFVEILGELPKVDHKLLTDEKGSGKDAPDLGSDKDNKQLAEEAKKLAKEKNIPYTQALKEVAEKHGK